MVVRVRDILIQGYSELGPYNAIHVGAAAPELPNELVQQLARPGRLVIPIDNPLGDAQYVQIFF